MNLKDFMECVDYNITGTDDYLWACYGPNAKSMDYWNHDLEDGITITCVFDTRTAVVYEMQAWHYEKNVQYRWIRPEYRDAHENESESRSVDPDQSYDEFKFIDLEVEEDILEKARAIFLDEEFDHRILVPLELDSETELALFRGAHKADMTVNEYVQSLLRQEIEKRS